jgi:hypothetical protein
VRSVGRTTLTRVGIGIACLVVLGIIYQHQRHPRPSAARAVSTVEDELARRGVAVQRVTCQTNHLDPTRLPAVVQVASLHSDQTPLLYDCSADLGSPPPKNEQGSDRSWCVLGFSGSAPWIAYSTANRCASMVAST